MDEIDIEELEELAHQGKVFCEKYNNWWQRAHPVKERPPQPPPETPPTPQIEAKRLDRIWKYLQGWITTPKHEELQAWAIETFGYRYNVTGQKYPVELKDAVCQKLNAFTDPQLTDLEKILEGEEE